MIANFSRFCRWPARELRRLQDRHLVDYLREDLVPFSPYYARLFRERGIEVDSIQGVEDLAALPFTTKDDLVRELDADPLSFVLQPTAETIRSAWPMGRLLPLAIRKLLKGEADVKRVLQREYRPIFMTATTGRSARPISFVYSKTDLVRLGAAGRRLAHVLGLTMEDRILNLFPYAPHLAFWQTAFAGFEARIFVLSTGGGKTVGTAGNLRALAKMKPTCIIGVPSYVYHILRSAEAEGVEVPTLRTIVLGAERITDGLKARIADLCGRLGAARVQVRGTFGFTEAKTAWAESAAGGYVLYPDMEVFEIVDPETGAVKGPGESGEIVYTSLGAHGTAILRYRTGDWAEGGITWEPCPITGRTLPRLSSRISRLSNRTDYRLTKVKGTLVDLNHIMTILSDRPEIEEWQLEIRKANDDPADVDIMTLYCSPRAGASIDREAVSRAIFDATEVSLNGVVVEELAALVARIGLETEMKEQRVVDRRPTE